MIIKCFGSVRIIRHRSAPAQSKIRGAMEAGTSAVHLGLSRMLAGWIWAANMNLTRPGLKRTWPPPPTSAGGDHDSMLVRTTGGTAATTAPAPTAARTTRRRIVSARGTGREGGKLLPQLGGTAMRTFHSDPIAGADQDFAVAFAFAAVEFVNWHGPILTELRRSSSRRCPRAAPDSARRGRAGLLSLCAIYFDRYDQAPAPGPCQATRHAARGD